LSAPPHTYYQAIPERLGDHMKMMKEDLNEIEKLAIMVDADEEGIYCKSLQNQYKTDLLFFLKYSKMGAKGFGAGNFKALFESRENRHYEEHYKNLIFFTLCENITNHQHVILLIMC
jgi:4-hydroxyphenylpyruvate dioxygenase